MLVTFSSDAYESITYFDKVAQRLLTLMGHSGTIPGALVAEDISDALENLHQGIKEEGHNPTSPKSPKNTDEEEPEISLAHRAVPLIHLLEAAEKKQCNVIWEYR